ncbi:DUF1330 domain-containing protein [Magnetococcus sp. PR-3]|uniref:DUF1330 domain-containing protein n=1 Tax=Magnetococcus sp. PR-3 TaxID=3120355 RepID=UPI002FCE468A
MATYLVGQILIQDQEKWQRYVAGVAESLQPFPSVELVFRGKKRDVLAGHNPTNDVVVIRFPDGSTLDKWFQSPAYQKLIPLRDEAAQVTITTYASTP